MKIFSILLTLFALVLVTVSTYANPEIKYYRCTETWGPYSVTRDCATASGSQICETCQQTGNGCIVTCVESTISDSSEEGVGSGN